MKWLTLLLPAFFATAQTATHHVYFEHDAYAVNTQYSTMLKAFADSIHGLPIDKIEVTGWCDDTGTNAYNMALSLKRAMAVAAFFETPSLWVEGKGELPAGTAQDIASARQKNRRVTITAYISPKPPVIAENNPLPPTEPVVEATPEPEPEAEAPVGVNPVYKTFDDKLEPGDKILLKNLVFEGGYTDLTSRGKRELKKLLNFLKQNPALNFEIQGHACCIYEWERDAIDEATGKANLSKARAKYIYDYLLENGIDASRMTHQGFGGKHPILGGEEKDNKRVEILIK